MVFSLIFNQKKKQKEKKRPTDLKKPARRQVCLNDFTSHPVPWRRCQVVYAIYPLDLTNSNPSNLSHCWWFRTFDNAEKKNTGQFKFRSLWTNVPHKSMKVSERSRSKLSQRTLKNDWCNWHFSCPLSKFVHCSRFGLLLLSSDTHQLPLSSVLWMTSP